MGTGLILEPQPAQHYVLSSAMEACTLSCERRPWLSFPVGFLFLVSVNLLPASSSLLLVYTLTTSILTLSRSLISGSHGTLLHVYPGQDSQCRSIANRIPGLGKPSGWSGSLRADLSPDSTRSMPAVLLSIWLTLTSWVFCRICSRRMRKWPGSLLTSSCRLQQFRHSPARQGAS